MREAFSELHVFDLINAEELHLLIL